MTFATMHDALPFFGYSALALLGCAAPLLWARWTVRESAWALRVAALLTVGIAIAIVVAGVPLLLAIVAILVASAVLARRDFEPAGQRVAAVLIVAAGLPLYGLTLLLLVFGVAAVGCAPDAYECPI